MLKIDKNKFSTKSKVLLIGYRVQNSFALSICSILQYYFSLLFKLIIMIRLKIINTLLTLFIPNGDMQKHIERYSYIFNKNGGKS